MGWDNHVIPAIVDEIVVYVSSVAAREKHSPGPDSSVSRVLIEVTDVVHRGFIVHVTRIAKTNESILIRADIYQGPHL
jgi:hypothetical protein